MSDRLSDRSAFIPQTSRNNVTGANQYWLLNCFMVSPADHQNWLPIWKPDGLFPQVRQRVLINQMRDGNVWIARRFSIRRKPENLNPLISPRSFSRYAAFLSRRVLCSSIRLIWPLRIAARKGVILKFDPVKTLPLFLGSFPGEYIPLPQLRRYGRGLLLQEFSCSGYKVREDQAPVIKFRWKSGYNFRNKHNF